MHASFSFALVLFVDTS